MAVPVIATTTSILGFQQYEAWEFQPSATNTPTSWACSTLPTGISINGTTGKISGVATVAGVTTANLTAINGSGTSTALVITIGIEANSQIMEAAPAYAIDVATGTISYASGAIVPAKTPLFWMKEGEKFPALFKWYNDGAFLDFTISSLKLVLKEFEPESSVLAEGGATLDTDFAKLGTGTDAAWLIVIDTAGDALQAALSNHEADAGTMFYALAEMEWKYANPFAIGTTPFVRKTRTFVIAVERNLVS